MQIYDKLISASLLIFWTLAIPPTSARPQTNGDNEQVARLVSPGYQGLGPVQCPPKLSPGLFRTMMSERNRENWHTILLLTPYRSLNQLCQGSGRNSRGGQALDCKCVVEGTAIHLRCIRPRSMAPGLFEAAASICESSCWCPGTKTKWQSWSGTGKTYLQGGSTKWMNDDMAGTTYEQNGHQREVGLALQSDWTNGGVGTETIHQCGLKLCQGHEDCKKYESKDGHCVPGSNGFKCAVIDRTPILSRAVGICLLASEFQQARFLPQSLAGRSANAWPECFCESGQIAHKCCLRDRM